MKKYLLTLLLFCTISTYAQDLKLEKKQNIDSLDLWEFSFSKSTENKDVIGILFLKRKKEIYSEDHSKSITPQIAFDIYPISFSNSIKNLESNRIQLISCCYPKCGATIHTSVNFVFWSDPWSITSSLDCNGIDYTRKNAELILEYIKNRNYNSIEELIIELPIKQIKN